MKFTLTIPFITTVVLGCENCYGPRDDSVHVRNVRRMQPESQNAHVGPRAPLEWGQLNFLQTTDTHGWLEGLTFLNSSKTFIEINTIADISRSRTMELTGAIMQPSLGT